MHNQIQVVFFSKQPNISAIPAAPIRIPSDLRRFGLSEIINHLLGNSANKISYDFLIDGQLLRVSMQEYVESHNLSVEDTLSVEVIESLPAPKEVDAFEHEDWISSVTSTSIGNKILYLTGSLDGSARVWNADGQQLGICTHGKPIKSVACVPSDNEITFVTGSHDSNAKLWKYDSASGVVSEIMTFKGHEASIETIAVSADGQQIITGSFDTSIKLWDMDISTALSSTVSAPTATKKRKTNTQTLIKSSISTLNGHSRPVTGVVYDKSDACVFYSSSMDHSVRVWDVASKVNTNTLSSPHAALCIDANNTGLIASGHSDKIIRLWDPRSSEDTLVKMSLQGHQSWVSGVCWSPVTQYHLASCSYDGSVKFWDIRSNTHIYSVAGDGSKLLDVEWAITNVAAGGEDKKLRIFSSDVTSGK